MKPAPFIRSVLPSVLLSVLLSVLALSVVAGRAAAHDEASGVESSPSVTRGSGPSPGQDDTSSRWRGSILLFDQSLTTQTVGVGADYQSYDPTYEWWVALKPKYALIERPNDAVTLNLWMNLYLELTNSDTTTEYHQLLVGPTYLWATYGHTLRDRDGYKSAVTIGPRVTLPTDKGAYDTGQIVGLGAVASVTQGLRLAGDGARAMRGGRLGLGAIYNHSFDRSTAPVNDDIHQLREDVAGRTIISDQLSGQMNVHDALSLSFSGDLQLLRRLSLSLSYVVINSWRYPPPSVPIVTSTGPVTPMTVADPTTYEVKTWVTAALGYDLMDELSVSLGYYNLAYQIGPDGTRRDPLWSPSARFFLTFTSNLDAVYRRLAARNHPRPPMMAATPTQPPQ